MKRVLPRQPPVKRCQQGPKDRLFLTPLGHSLLPPSRVSPAPQRKRKPCAPSLHLYLPPPTFFATKALFPSPAPHLLPETPTFRVALEFYFGPSQIAIPPPPPPAACGARGRKKGKVESVPPQASLHAHTSPKSRIIYAGDMHFFPCCRSLQSVLPTPSLLR